ncbi:MAG: hypothetical protein ACYTFG_06890, partial [Planctomycetota bacterium]
MIDESGQRLRLVLSRIAWRISAYRLARRLSRAVLICSIPASLVLLASRLHPLPHAVPAGVFLLLCGLMWGALEGLKNLSNLAEAAILADRRMSLNELLPTALEMGSSGQLGAALLGKAVDAAGRIEPRKIGTFPLPWEPLALLTLGAGVFSVMVLAPPKVVLPSGVVSKTARIGVQAREIMSTAGDIEARFPSARDDITESLEEIARRLTGPRRDYVETGEMMARLGRDADKEADRLKRSEEALAEAVGGGMGENTTPEV